MTRHLNNYPLFFKLRVIEYYNNMNDTVHNILKIFKISNGSLYNWLRQYNSDNLSDKKQYTKKSKFLPHIKCYIRHYILSKKIFIMSNLIVLLKKKFNVYFIKYSIYDIIKKFKITRKRVKTNFILGKKRNHCKKITKLRHQLKQVKRSDIIIIDETSVDTHINSLYGWSLKGVKIKSTKRAYRSRYTIICGISDTQVIHYKIINGSSNSQTFKEFVREIVLNGYNNNYLLMDNASIHHSKLVTDYINTTNNHIVFNAPYSPELNPIECMFSKFKSTLYSKTNNHISPKLKHNIRQSLNKITSSNLTNYFDHSLNLLFKK